jgi:hypothetical protein
MIGTMYEIVRRFEHGTLQVAWFMHRPKRGRPAVRLSAAVDPPKNHGWAITYAPHFGAKILFGDHQDIVVVPMLERLMSEVYRRTGVLEVGVFMRTMEEVSVTNGAPIVDGLSFVNQMILEKMHKRVMQLDARVKPVLPVLCKVTL